MYSILVGFMLCFFSVIYNIWGFTLPYFASNVNLEVEVLP